MSHKVTVFVTLCNLYRIPEVTLVVRPLAGTVSAAHMNHLNTALKSQRKNLSTSLTLYTSSSSGWAASARLASASASTG